MLRRVGAQPALAVCIACAAGCSLLTSFDGYVGGAPAVEARTVPAIEAGGANDDSGGTTDAANPNDGGPDPVGYCDDATACDDFEREDALGTWEQLLVDNGGNLATSTARPHWGERSLRATLPSPAGAVGALLRRYAQVSKIRLAYFVFVPSPRRAIQFSQIRFVYSDRVLVIGLFSDDNVYLSEQEFTPAAEPTFASAVATNPTVLDRWLSVNIDIDVGAVPPRITATVDGHVIANDAPLSRNYGRTKVELYLGVPYDNAGPATAVDIDDVRLDVIP